MGLPAVWVAAALIAGASLAFLVDISPGLLRAALACALLALFAASRCSAAVLALLVAAVFACGGVLLTRHAREAALHTQLRAVLHDEFGGFRIDSPGPEGSHPPLTVRARLLDDASVAPSGARMRVHVGAIRLPRGWIPAGGDVVVNVSGVVQSYALASWRGGRTVEMPVTLRRPARYFNLGVSDFERSLALGGTTLFGSVKSGLLVDVVGFASWRHERAADVRARVRAAVTRWVSPHSKISGAIVAAILIGDRTAVPDDVRERLQDAGVYHVLAISGGNIAILVGMALVACRLAGITGRIGNVLTLIVLLAYAQVVVAGASVFRAVVMAATYLAARVFDHRVPPWQTIGLAAVVTIALDPLDLVDAGFLLTFSATAALLGVVNLAARLRPLPVAVRWLACALLASLATELVLLPIGALQFGRVTFVGIVANLAAIPLMTLAQVGGLALALGSMSDVVGAAAGWIAHLGAAGLVECARLADLLPWLTARVPAPSPWTIGAYYLAGLAAIRLRGRMRPPAIAMTIVVATAIVTGYPWPARHLSRSSLQLTMFDVGQGEAIRLAWPGGASMLVDAGGIPFGGGGFDVGDRIVRPALWAVGASRLDDLLVTHGDPDHIGGAEAVVESFAPRRLLEGVIVPGHGPFERLRAAARRREAAVRELVAGAEWTEGGASIRVLSPPRADWERRRVRNDDSVVLEVTYGDVAILLTGDISADVERHLFDDQATSPVARRAATRILKVAHHGSRTSTSQALIDAWKPQIALISCGRGNRFGHPAPEVLDRLRRAGTRVYRTDRHGAITLTTDGAEVRVTTMLP